jgi:glutathione S-transferase
VTTDPRSQPVRLYELMLENGRSASPFVWRIRYALAHKGIAYESLPIGFIEIPKVFGGRLKTLPVIEHGETMMAESWDIAEYLDQAFPERPRLFSSPAENATVRLFDSWFTIGFMRPLLPVIVLDVYNAARPADRPYFRQSREARFKTTLEAFSADRVARLPAIRESLAPLRHHLSTRPFLGGDAPNYADYIGFGVFQWVASVATVPLLAAEDEVLRGWLERGFDLYGGIGRDARMRPLFEQPRARP